MIRTKDNTIRFTYILITAFAVLFTWMLHEFAHWAAGTYLGYDMAMTLNKTYPVSGAYDTDAHYQLISAAGPLVTLLEAIVIFFTMRSFSTKWLYPFLFTCFYMRLLAAGISLGNPNDEARISQSLGIGTFTLPIVMNAILFFLLYKISGLYGFSKKFNFLTLCLVLLFSSVLILLDQFFGVRVI